MVIISIFENGVKCNRRRVVALHVYIDDQLFLLSFPFCHFIHTSLAPPLPDNFGLDRAADLIYDKAEGCCPEKWGGGGCPKEEI